MSLALCEGMTDERVDWHLWNWSQWMRGEGRDSVTMEGYTGSRDFDSMVASADRRCAEAVDAIVDDLEPIQRAAVCHKLLGAVFRLRGDLDTIFAAACEIVKKGLVRRGIV